MAEGARFTRSLARSGSAAPLARGGDQRAETVFEGLDQSRRTRASSAVVGTLPATAERVRQSAAAEQDEHDAAEHG